MPMPERQDDHDQVLRAQAQRVPGERRPEDGDDADQRRRDPEVGQRPGDRRVVADVADPLAQLAEHATDGLARPRSRHPYGAGTAPIEPGRGRLIGGSDGSVRQKTAASAKSDRDDDDQRLRPAADRDDQRRRAARSPRANAPFRVSVKIPFAATSCSRGHEDRDHRRLGRRKEHGHDREDGVQQEEEPDVVAGREDRRPARAARRAFVTTSTDPPVDPVDVHAGERGEQHGRDEEGQEQAADRARSGRSPRGRRPSGRTGPC